MKRKLFFFIERLQVSRQEIRAVSLCLILLLTGTQFLPAIQNARMEHAPDYTEQDRIFMERTEAARQRHREWVDRLSWVDSLNQGEDVVSGEGKRANPDVAGNGEGLADRQGDGVSDDRLNLNRATVRELQELPGIGPVYAQRVVQWRDRYGPYLSVDQLIEIRGIGLKRLEALRPRLRVSTVQPDSL